MAVVDLEAEVYQVSHPFTSEASLCSYKNEWKFSRQRIKVPQTNY